MHLELVVASVVEALESRLLDGTVHSLDLTVRLRVVYSVFAIGLFTHRLAPVVVVLIFASCRSGIAFDFESPILQTYTNMRLIVFFAEFLFAIAYLRFGSSRAVFFLPVGILALFGADYFALVPLIVEAAIATAIVTGALGCETKGWVSRSPVLKLLGDASYSIYLSHALVIVAVNSVFMTLALSGMTQFLSLLSVTISLSVIVGILVYRYIERPLLKLLVRRRVKRVGIETAKMPAAR